MKTILIAGAGQLGSRHLQGVKTSENELDIWVYDLSRESLRVAEERYNQVESENKTAHFVDSLEDVPNNIDVLIVASSSKPRAIIVKQVLASKKVKYMVLEKFLFTRMSEYEEIKQLIDEKEVKTWVNCPRRMWDGYSFISQYIDTTKPVSFDYEDTDWGLCCNTVHYIDIFMLLSGSKSFSVNLDGVEPEVVDSKRAGYVELHGEEVFTTDNGSELSLLSTMKAVEDAKVVIKNGSNTILYYEGTGKVFINGEEHDVKVHYQSGLSGILVDELLEKGTCRLATYAESSYYHKTYLSTIAPFINKIKGWTSDACPIT